MSSVVSHGPGVHPQSLLIAGVTFPQSLLMAGACVLSPSSWPWLRVYSLLMAEVKHLKFLLMAGGAHLQSLVTAG